MDFLKSSGKSQKSQLGHCCYLPNSVQFVIHISHMVQIYHCRIVQKIIIFIMVLRIAATGKNTAQKCLYFGTGVLPACLDEPEGNVKNSILGCTAVQCG
jgi:hypothetical protein